MSGLFVASTGMTCAVGLTGAAACAAIRAGVSGFEEQAYHDNHGDPVIGASVPGLDLDIARSHRLLGLLAAAVADCLRDQNPLVTDSLPALICVADRERPGGYAWPAPLILDRLQARLDIALDLNLSAVIATGHTSGYEALRMAREMLRAGQISACLVCGVDSYINAASLSWLDRHQRLKTSASPHGLIPGEAAAAVLLQRRPAVPRRVEIVGLGFGQEAAHVLSEEPLLGWGLTDAVRGALSEAELGLHEIDWRMSDATGEQYGFKELALVEARLVRVVRKQPQPVWHCADSIGDTGAASGIAQLVIADAAVRGGYAPGDYGVCLGSSVMGSRAAAVIRRSDIPVSTSQ